MPPGSHASKSTINCLDFSHEFLIQTAPYSNRGKSNANLISHGLTLPELLISVAIVGLLSSIALPNYINSINSTRQKDVANQIANIQTSIEAYREEFLINPSGWDALARIAPVSTNNGSAKGSTFTPITSSNGGYYTVSISSAGNLLSLSGTPVSSRLNGWNIKACLNTQTGLSDTELGNGTTAAATPVCT
jgi:prepilin-type N-terminal cleavage/methylation domain-containing protein